MKSNLENYKYIDKSTHLLFNEKDTFKVFYFNNLTSNNELFKHQLNNNYIQIYFCNTNKSIVAFNIEHCATNLEAGNSTMVYFKDEKMNILFNIPPKSELIAVLISIEYFHSLFSIEGNFLFNYNGFKVGKPIIEPKLITPTIQHILNQLISKQIIKALFINGGHDLAAQLTAK